MGGKIESIIKVALVGALVATGVALIPGIGAIATGAFTGTTMAYFGSQFIIGSILGAVGAALADSPKFPSAADIQGRTISQRNPIASRKVVYGTIRTGGAITFMESDDVDLHTVVSIAGHEINAVKKVFLNDVAVTGALSDGVRVDANSGTEPDYSDTVKVTAHFGTDLQTADTNLTSNTSVDVNFRGRGIAYIYTKMVFDVDDFPSGLPNISAEVEGKKVYDPRTSTTVYSNNPALCIRDYLTNTEYGLGATADEIDDTMFSTAANVCDESVSLANGSTEKRYTLNGIVDTANNPKDILAQMKTACDGTIYYANGKWKLRAGKYITPTNTLTLDDLRGSIKVETRVTSQSQFNAVKGIFVSPENNWQPTDFPEVTSSTFETEDGGNRKYIDYTLPFTTSSSMAQRIAKQALYRNREQITVTMPCKLTAFKYEIGDTVMVTLDRYGWSSKVFEVVSWGLAPEISDDNFSLGVDLVLKETSSTVYDWDENTDEKEFTYNNTTLPIPTYVAPVTNLVVTPSVITGTDGTFNSVIDISWTASTDGFVNEYIITVTPSSGSVYSYKTDKTDHRFHVMDFTVTYTIEVRALSVMGVRSTPVSATPATPIADSTPPAAPSSVSIIGTFQKFILKWTNPSDLDLSHIEIKRSHTSSQADGTVVGETRGDSWEDAPYTGTVTRWFWVRAVDISGNASAWVATGNATTVQLIGDDFDEGVIEYDFMDRNFKTLFENKATQEQMDASATTALRQLMDEYRARKQTQDDIAYAKQDVNAHVIEAQEAIAEAKTTLIASINDNVAAIAAESTARADADSAIASDVTTLYVETGENAAQILIEAQARSDLETAHASLISGLETTVGENTASVTEAMESIDGVKAQYSVTIDNNGHISGFGLMSDIIDGNPTSAFIVNADQFAIGSDGNYPFVYYAHPTRVTKDGAEYIQPAGTYIKDANIQVGAIASAHIQNAIINSAHIDTLDADDIKTGTLSADRIAAGGITSDKITINDNIEFSNGSSGLVFGKTSLGSTTTGAFYGRAVNTAGDDIVGFHISSPSSSMYTDSDGNFSLSNVKIFAGEAGSSTYFDGAGDYTINISTLSTSLAIELIGGGAGACNNPAGDRPSSWRKAGAAGGDSWIEFYDGLDGAGSMIGSRITATGGVSTAWQVGSNNADYDGADGENSSQPNSGGSGGGQNTDSTAPTLANGPQDGTRGGGGGGAGIYGRNGSFAAGVTIQADAGQVVSQIISVPSGAKSLKIHLGTGGQGGGKDGAVDVWNDYYSGGVMTGWFYTTGGTTYYLTNGADGGDGYFEFSDPNTGGIEVDLVDLLNRVIALEAYH